MKARQLPSLPSAVTAKQAVGEAHLSDIIDQIVDELRPHQRPKKDVHKLVRTVIVELLPTEVTRLKRRLKGTPADALTHLKKLRKCAAELERLLVTLPNRIAWVGEMRSGMLGVSYATGPETSILLPNPVEHPGWKLGDFISHLGRLQTAAKLAERHVGPSPLYEIEKHLSARFARFLIVALSKTPPTSTGPLRTIAGLIFEVITGEKDINLERHCKAEISAAAPKPPTRG